MNPEFLVQYKGALDKTDIKIVMYSPEALEIKRMEMISPEDIKKAFGDDSILVFTNGEQLQDYIESLDKKDKVFLMMSSGNFGGVNLNELFKA